MRALVLTPEAFDDLRAARRWYDEQCDDREIVVVLVFHTAQDPARALRRLRRN